MTSETVFCGFALFVLVGALLVLWHVTHDDDESSE